MDERDLEAEHPAARRLVDQLCACTGEIGECNADVVHFVGDVMHARPALCEKAADGSVLPERSEQLDATLANAKRCGLDALVIDALAMLERRAEQPRVRVDRAVEVGYSNSDVVDRARRDHAS